MGLSFAPFPGHAFGPALGLLPHLPQDLPLAICPAKKPLYPHPPPSTRHPLTSAWVPIPVSFPGRPLAVGMGAPESAALPHQRLGPRAWSVNVCWTHGWISDWSSGQVGEAE